MYEVTNKRKTKYATANFTKMIVYSEIKGFQQYHVFGLFWYLSNQMTLRQVQETKSNKSLVETDTNKLLERSKLLTNMEE